MDDVVPWWAEVHIFFGFVLFYWIMTPILYYTNVCPFPVSVSMVAPKLVGCLVMETRTLPDLRE